MLREEKLDIFYLKNYAVVETSVANLGAVTSWSHNKLVPCNIARGRGGEVL